ncbi:MAG: hypothetical protein RI907_822, partial [Pseudomonadota bacterium]
YRVLYTLYPAQRATFDKALQLTLGAIPDSAAKTSGVALGDDIAKTILAIRAADGYQDLATESGSDAVGAWRPTGPMFLVAQDPQWGGVTPFALTSGDAFRADPPPALDSAAYAAALNQVQSLGAVNSTTRTADQTQQAHFWADGGGSYTPPGHWMLIAKQVAQAQGQSLSANARLMAELSVALADAAIACWDTKYTYDFWRPVTAIQNADQDGNAATTLDATWQPLLINPPHPSYVSGHSTFSAAAAAILADTFGDNTAFTTTSPTLPGVTRSFTSFSQAADEAGLSRIYGGIHTSLDNEAGKALGGEVAQAVLARFKLSEDKQAPTVVAASTPAATATNLTITGQILDNLSGVASATVQVDGGASQALTLNAQGNFSFTTGLALDGTADGAHQISIVARDAAGNVSQAYVRSFTLDTRAPTVGLTSLADGASLSASARLTGSASGTGTGLTLLSYQLDTGAVRNLTFDSSTGSFDTALDYGQLDVGDHTLKLSVQDAAGNRTTRTLTLKVDALASFTITDFTPVNGTQEVGVTQRPKVVFSRAVNVNTLTSESFYATGPDGSKLAASIVPAADGTYAWLFLSNPMPGGATITVHLQGGLIRAAADGAFLDGDTNGSAGGEYIASFTTVSTEPVAGTKLVGKVVDPGPDLDPMTFDDIRRGPDGVIHTADDIFLLPIAHAKVYILGQEDQFVFTDANGNFELTNVPAGSVKVAIDGRTATNAPNGVFFPEMVMDATLTAGRSNTLMGSMGGIDERLANADRVEIYLPRIATSVMQAVSDTATTVITATDPAAAPQLTDEQRQQLTLTINPGTAVDANGQALSNVTMGVATVPPELVKDMLPPGVLEHTFDITIQAPGVAAFTEPVQITLPNVFNAAPGTKLNLLSFDHTTGMLVIDGTGTVSADGLTVVSDPGSGVKAPGWHGMAPPGPNGRRDTPRRPNPTPPTPPTPTNPTPPTPPTPPVVIYVPPVVPWNPPNTTVIVIGGNPGGSGNTGNTGNNGGSGSNGNTGGTWVPGTANLPGYQIDVVAPLTGLSAAQRGAIQSAIQRWEQVVVGDIPADLTTDGLVDDLRIRLNIASVDGAGGTLATTQLLDVRSGSLKLPSLAEITLDQADLASWSLDQLKTVMLHEIAHAMGFGELWASLGLVNASVASNPVFTGTNAQAAYAALTGGAATGVPLDNRSGANATHWREAVFGNELLTPLLDVNGPYPISALSAAALKDMGYTVNPANADSYSLPGAGFVFHPNATAAANAGAGELLDATGGGFSVSQVKAAAAPTAADHLFFAFDFGSSNQAVAPGYAGVSASTTYSAARGWGWAGGSVTDQTTGNTALAPQTADQALVTQGTFKVDLPNGTYDVIVVLGDDQASHEGMEYTIQGDRRGSVSLRKGEHTALTHRVEVVNGQMQFTFGSNGVPLTLDALEIHQVSTYTTPANNIDYTSGAFYIAIENLDTGFILRNKVEVTPGSALCINGVVLSPNTAYRQYVYHVESNTIGISEFVTPASGVDFNLPEVVLGGSVSPDTDGDGLENAAEFIIGTDIAKADTDGDGLGDRIEVQQDLDPLGGASVATGVIANVAMLGDAQALDVQPSPTNPAKLTAYVATGSRGLAIVDVSRATSPVLLADIDLPGTAVDVANDPTRGRTLVAAATAGLVILDTTTPAAPRVLQTITFDTAVSNVELRDGLAFVTHGASLSVVDVNTGEIRQTTRTEGNTFNALAVDANGVYGITDGTVLRAFRNTHGVLTAAGTLSLPTVAQSLFVADGVATIGAGTSFLGGYMTANVADLSALTLLSGVDLNSLAGDDVALNGSGLGVLVGIPGGAFGGRFIDVVRTSDPTDTGTLVARYDLPTNAAPHDVVIAGGIAFVASGPAGMQVVNYIGFDNKGQAPSVSITADATDMDASLPGVQVVEGHSVTIKPTVADDVQIRSLELLVNGTVVLSDDSYPFELTTAAPLLSAGNATMTLQVRATDTGGNSSLSNVVTLNVVADTFAPLLSSIDLNEGDRRFIVRTVNLGFDEAVAGTALTAANVRIVRAGADGTFGTADDVGVPLHIDSRFGGQQISVVVDTILPAGDYLFQVDANAVRDAVGNTLATAITRHFTIRPASDVRALSGTPDVPTAPSANPSQQIGITVPFDPATARMQVNIIDPSDNKTTRVLTPTWVDAANQRAVFTVPPDAVTGDVVVYSLVGSTRTDFTDGSFPLQILPTITNVQVESVAADGASAVVVLTGTGFVEGASKYRLGTTVITDVNGSSGPDVTYRYDGTLGTYVYNGVVRLTVPLSNGVFGAISVETAGGTSAAYTASI